MAGGEDDDEGEGEGDDEEEGDDVVGEDGEECPEEGYDEALPDFGDDAHDLLVGEVVPGGVDAGDGVDDCGGGEEGEDEEEDEVGGFEEPKGCPFRGDHVGELVVLGRPGLSLAAVDLAVDNLVEEDVGDLDVDEDEEAEREDEGECDLAEDLAPRKDELVGLAEYPKHA